MDSVALHASAVLMIPPVEFGFNPETAQDNEFQKPQADEGAPQSREAAQREFILAVDTLSQAGVRVLIPPYEALETATPDAIFPNNWLATDVAGTLYTFPMLAANRRAEVQRLPAVQKLLREMGHEVRRTVAMHPLAEQQMILEGTGSLVFDTQARRVYAARSHRTDPRLVERLAAELGYTAILFDTQSRKGKPYYHTNVVLAIGQDWALLGAESLPGPDRARVLEALREGHHVWELSYAQIEDGFAANVLELASDTGERLLAVSETAWHAFTPELRAWFMQRLTPVICPIPTIERLGGGSLRCMLAEIFLPMSS